MKIQNFRLNQNGLERMLGKLESKIMRAVWALGSPTVKDVIDFFDDRVNYKTIMTVMNRLVEKDFLTRRKVARAYVYAARLSQDDFYDRLSRQVLNGLVQDFGSAALTQFVEVVAETDRARLAALAALIERKLDEEKDFGE